LRRFLQSSAFSLQPDFLHVLHALHGWKGVA